MDLYFMEIISIISHKVGVSLQTVKDKFMKDNGKMELNKGKVFGKVLMEKHIWVNGKMVNHKDMEFSST